MIRPARPEDADRIRHIEREAGRRFADIGMPEVAEDEPFPVETLHTYALDGRGWVAVTDDDVAVGYLLVDVVAELAHVEQVSVLPEHQGGGIGRSLLDTADDWARGRGLAAMTLTTFADVPWNRPLYEHLGFRCLEPEEISAPLQAIRDAEAAQGLDPAARVVMRRDL